MDVPKVIHQTWKSRRMHRSIEGCVQSFPRLNPGWEHRFYLDEDWEAVVRRSPHFDWATFEAIPSKIQQADVFRLIALCEAGGVYADVDIECLKPLDDLLRDAAALGIIAGDTELVLVRNHRLHELLMHHGEIILMNDYMVARPGAAVLGHFLESIRLAVTAGTVLPNDVLGTTGPVAITAAVRDFGGIEAAKVAVLPTHWIHPLPDMTLRFSGIGEFHRKIRTGSWIKEFHPYAAHYWWHSYWPGGTMLNRYVRNLPVNAGLEFPADPTLLDYGHLNA